MKIGVVADISQFTKTMQTAANRMVSLAQGFLAIETLKMGGGAFAGFVKGSMDAINSTRVMAERLGTSTEALSELQYAAKLSDVDNETLSSSLEKLNVKLAETATGAGGPAAEALHKLGLNAKTLVGEGPVEAFKDIAAAMETIPNPAQRAAASSRALRQIRAGHD